MFIYCKYKVLLALQYQSQYPVFNPSSHVDGLCSQYWPSQRFIKTALTNSFSYIM